MRLPWMGSLKKKEELSPLVGLSFAALYLLAVAGVGGSALYLQRTELWRQHVADMQRWTGGIVRDIGSVREELPDRVRAELRKGARQEGVEFCALVRGGKFIAHSDPTLVGHAAPSVKWDGAANNESGARVGTTQTTVASSVLTQPLNTSSAANATDLWVGLSPLPQVWQQSSIIVWSGYVVLAVLGLYLLVYRLFRKAIQPLEVIRRRLTGSTEPIGERILALRLNDSFDQVSRSWNELIEFVGTMQEQLRRSRLSTDVTAAMDGFRSDRLTRILMQIPFGVIVVDGEGKISFANRSACGMLSVDGEPLEGRETLAVFQEKLASTLFGSQGRSALLPSRWVDHTFERPHGAVVLRFWCTSSDSTQQEHVVFVQDVTQAKEAERARDNFLYHVTHELRTPLTNIRAYAETLSQGVIEDAQTIRECYNVIMGETQRLNRLVEDILNVSQLEVGSARLDVGDVQVEKLLRSVVQDMQGTADSKNIELVLNLPAKMPQLRGDKERLAVVFTNLVGNAIKYTHSGGRVDVRCLAEAGRLRVGVTDTGIGIKPEDTEKIFEKFYRVDNEEVAAIPGTGLGLAIVKETIRLHGGSIFVESKLGQGSTFTVTLPAVVLEEGTAGGKAVKPPVSEKV